MRTNTRHLLAAGLTLALPVLAQAQAHSWVDVPVPGLAPMADRWPADVVKTMTELLAVKGQAMKVVNMRSENGVVGYRFAQLMDQLAAQSDAAGLAGKAKTLEGEDITAKLIVLARDRRAGPDLYKRIAADYVDWPEEPPPSKTEKGPQSRVCGGLQNPAVTPEDREESILPALEYAYFAPPCGPCLPKGTDNGILNIFSALLQAGRPEKLRALMAVDFVLAAGCQASGPVPKLRDILNGSPPSRMNEVPGDEQGDPRERDVSNGVSMVYLAAFPGEMSFRALACPFPLLNDRFKDYYAMMEKPWKPEFWKQQAPAANAEDAARQNREAWMKLAGRELPREEERMFADFLKKALARREGKVKDRQR